MAYGLKACSCHPLNRFDSLATVTVVSKSNDVVRDTLLQLLDLNILTIVISMLDKCIWVYRFINTCIIEMIEINFETFEKDVTRHNYNRFIKTLWTIQVSVSNSQGQLKQIHTLRVHYAHAAANLNSGYSKYAKVARVHYFCTIALRTSRAVLTRAWASRRVDLRERWVDSFSKRVIIFCW